MTSMDTTYLLTVDEDVPSLPQLLINPTHRLLQMRLQIRTRTVHDIEPVALEVDPLFGVCVDGGKPGCVEDLDEGGDVGGGEEGRVEDGGEGTEVECSGGWTRGGWSGGRDDLVHRRAHCLHDFGW